MNKYLLISLLSVLPFTQAFAAEKEATINAEFKGAGKIIFEPTEDQKKKIEITSTETRTNTPVPVGSYNVTMYSAGSEDPCLAITNMPLEEGKIYKANNSDGCVITEEKTALNQ